jgi:Flp pilus assembly protein TadG
MLPPLIERSLIENSPIESSPSESSRRTALNRKSERGVTIALVAIAMVSMIAMAGLSIDVGTLYQASAEAQRVADAAALAAAQTISASGITGAGTPGNDTASWQQICGGGTSIATETAVAVAQQNVVGGIPVPSGSITVNYSVGNPAGAAQADCSTLGAGFGVNPVVTVKVTQSGLPTYFSRIWGRTGSTVGATASAEVFNPSGSNAYASGGEVVPVQPRCVKPMMIPNFDPLNPPGNTCTGTAPACNPFVSTANGSITNQGILAEGAGVIGETFWLMPDCHHAGGTCALRSTPPQANLLPGGNPRIPPTPNLDYLPGQTSYSSAAVPTCASGGDNYEQAVAGCDQSTAYQCGVYQGNAVDLAENPATGDTTDGAQCLIHQATTNNDTLAALGQDVLQPQWAVPPTYPFQIQAGTSNPLTAVQSSLVTTSTSIVSLPIYDSTVAINSTGVTQVTVIGFLQVFINYVDGNGNMNVTVVNVAGCGNGTNPVSSPVFGTSPVPVRLITPP